MVEFNPPISLPADHYFFRPEVLSSSGDFLWLSAPKPIVAPSTPFATDLQSWIRNDALAPDWLRIGTDITGQGPFNGAFLLFGETDADVDGVPDSLDLCPGTRAGAIVDENGCSIDQIAPCSGPASGGTWKNHGQYVSRVAQAAEAFLAQDLISAEQADEIVVQAAQSNCGSAGRQRRSTQCRERGGMMAMNLAGLLPPLPCSRGRGEEVRERNTKSQTPSSKEIPNFKFQDLSQARCLGAWDLELLWSLVFGVWSFLRRTP